MLGYEICVPMRLELTVEGRRRTGVPLTVDQSVSIVREYSYNEIVNPKAIHEQRDEREMKAGKGGTDRIFCCFLA